MKYTTTALVLIASWLLYASVHSAAAQSIDEETGLITETGFETVKEICTDCHSARLITQNRMNRETWLETIRWMQETQGLWEFDPETEKIILDYLTTNYSPLKTFRRPPLTVEWD